MKRDEEQEERFDNESPHQRKILEREGKWIFLLNMKWVTRREDNAIVIIQPPASYPDRQTTMAKGPPSYCTIKAPAVVNHLQPLSGGDPETGTPQQGRVDLTFFSSRTAWLLRWRGAQNRDRECETERKHEQPEAARFERERPWASVSWGGANVSILSRGWAE
jgi:hypothetical protein